MPPRSQPPTRGRQPNRNPQRGRSSNRGSAPSADSSLHRHRSPSQEQFPDIPDTDSDDDNSRATSRFLEGRDRSPPPVLISPIKRRARAAAPTINRQDDLAVWYLSDAEIIDAARVAWRSDAYNHYDVSLQRLLDSDGQPASMSYVFTCKSCPENHRPLYRPRSKTSEGTSNLVRTMNTCLEAQGISTHKEGDSGGSGLVPYSPAAHRAFIALRAAKSNRPFNSVADEDYLGEVQMLHPGAVVPSPITVSRDIKMIYAEMSRKVKEYFMALNCTIHLVLDGWTSPIVSSFLGLVIVWVQEGVIYRAILEFIRLTQKHDGAYLADVVAQCLKRFGLEKQLFSICMDNATNCDKLAECLCDHIPTFPGPQGRLRCLAHIFNLIAKVFISFFFKKPKRKRTIGVAAGARNGRFQRPGEPADSQPDSADEIDLDPGANDSDQELEEDDDLPVDEEDSAGDEGQDEGQSVHDEHVARTIQDKAIQFMERTKSIFLDQNEVKTAQQIFPRVAGLARRVHDSATLREKFDKLVSEDSELEGSRRALSRRVPTRWNSDLDCLLSHFYFKDIVEQLTATPSLNLKSYSLSAEQWKLAEDVREVLLLLDDVTKIFSQAQVPLVVDVIPTLEELREGLIAARDDTDNDVSDIVKVACQAGIFLIDKYSTFADNCDIYLIAIVMCPDRKLKWFKDHGRTTRQIKAIEKLVTERWNKKYASPNTVTSGTQTDSSRGRSRYAPAIAQVSLPPDHITTYLKEPLIPTSVIKEVGGYLQYWHHASSSRPLLSRMALDFCSAPATSVDAERAFSTGRRQINFMQTNMNSQTFKAQMAVGSWAKAPFYPGFNYVRDLIDKDISNDENPFLTSN